MDSELKLALDGQSVSAALPAELPVTHLTVARWLESILNTGTLQPYVCKVFHEELIYFSYGGIFYRTSKQQSENASELPIGIVLSPEAMDACSQLFPFDSGAMAGRVFGNDWADAFDPFKERFGIYNDDLARYARLLVHWFYQTNRAYLEGEPRPIINSIDPTITLLHAFLNKNLSLSPATFGGVDHRQRSVELASRQAIKLKDHLLWIGFPEFRTAEVLSALRNCVGRRIPQIHTYRFTRNFDPYSVAERLQDAAYDQVIARYAR
jgi:hypothetical protein